jgi:hypothetical protein
MPKTKKSSNISPMQTLQLGMAMVLVGLTCLGAGVYVRGANAAASDTDTSQCKPVKVADIPTATPAHNELDQKRVLIV